MRAFKILDYLIFSLESSDFFLNYGEKEKLKCEYLFCEVYLIKEDWESLLIRCRGILSSYGLSKNDYVSFLYLKGESLFKIGRVEEGRKIFLEIKKELILLIEL